LKYFLFSLFLILLINGCKEKPQVSISNFEEYEVKPERDLRVDPYSFEFEKPENNINDTFK